MTAMSEIRMLPERDESLRNTVTALTYVNGKQLALRSASSTGEITCDGRTLYIRDDGSRLYHYESDGPVALALELLKSFKSDTGIEPC
jgi:hypothetical protein